MFCEVITLRDAGRRLPPDQWPAPAVGELRMFSLAPSKNNLQRALREFLHYQRVGTQMALRLRLVDPVILEVLGDAMLIRGYETCASDGSVWEHEQLWLLRPRPSMDGPMLPPFDAQPYRRSVPST